jgi:hypothetical protein
MLRETESLLSEIVGILLDTDTTEEVEREIAPVNGCIDINDLYYCSFHSIVVLGQMMEQNQLK